MAMMEFESQSGNFGPRMVESEVLHSLFQRSAALHETRAAVAGKDRTLTYGELNRRANRLAQFLHLKGVNPGDSVAILLKRGPDLYIAILGVLKAGAAYVPLDTDFMEAHVNFILRDSGAKCLLSDRYSRSRYPTLFTKSLHRIVNIDEELHRTLSRTAWDRDPPLAVGPGAPAFLMYSREEGRTRSTAVSHASATNLVKAEGVIFNLNQEDKVTQGFSVAQGASIEEIWLTFQSGATLYPLSKHAMRSAEDLAACIAENGITVLSTLPEFLSTIQTPLPSLRLVILEPAI